jgi:flavin-dependent dehydrogenase
VGKHTLVIGDAGGFFASSSHEGIYPAMWSASIAAKVVQKAKENALSQDVLMTFDTRWRLKMGEFLRPPNTDLHLLLPLIFSNQPMADRMAAAFFGGENV